MNGDMGIERSGSNDRLTDRIIRCVISVHQALGPGFKESVYRNALIIELHDNSFRTQCEKEVSIFYKEIKVGLHKLDIIVEDKIILELKCAERLCKDHYAQVRSYLNASKLNTALLINFQNEHADYRRIVRSPHRS